MTKKTYSELIAEVAAQLPTNHVGLIQAVNIRTVFDDLLDTTVQVYTSPSITGRITAGQGDPESLTGTQVTTLLDQFTASLKGLVPPGGAVSGSFLRFDGTWAVPPGGSSSPGGTNGQVQYNNSGSFGGFTISGDATVNTGTGVLTIANGAVSYAKMQNVSATGRFLGRISGGSGIVEEFTGNQATALLNTFANTISGLVPLPSPSGGSSKFLREDAVWVVPPGGGGGSPGGANNTVQYNNLGAFGGMSGTSWDDTNRSLTLTGTTVTTSNPVINATQTWNAGVTFTGIRFYATDLASAAASKLIDLGVGANSKFSIDKSGNLNSSTSNQVAGIITTNTPVYNATQTWNSLGTTFVAFNLNITDNNSSVSSVFEQFQIAGVTKWAIRKDGTVTTGSWNGSPVGATFGGTGQSVYTIGDMLVANTTTTLAPLNDVATGNALISGGAGVIPSWGKIGLATHVSGNLPVANLNSGTNASATSYWRGDGTWTTINALYVNAADYGFSPSATGTNNFTFLSNALSAVSSGGTVFIPAGNYTITTALVPCVSLTNNNVRLLGAGMDNTIITTTTASQDIISVNAFNVTVENLHLKSSVTMNSGTAAMRVIGDRLTIQNIYIDGGPGSGTGGLIYDGLVLVGSTRNYNQLYRNFDIQRCKHAAVYVTGSGGTFNVFMEDFNIGCFWGTSFPLNSSNSTQYGVRADSSSSGGVGLYNVNILQCYDFGISSSGFSMSCNSCGPDTCGTDDYNFLNCNGVTIINCWAGATAGLPGSNQGNGMTFNGCNGVRIIGCTSGDLNVMFAWLQNCSDIVCTNNRCTWGNQSNSGAGAGFFVQNCTNFVIANNVMNNHVGEFSPNTGFFQYGVNIDALSGVGAGPSTYGRVDGNCFHPVLNSVVKNNASSGTISIGTNLGP